MRICLVSTELAGFRGGGIGTYVAEAGKALSAGGHEVWLITPDPGPERRAALRAQPGFHRVRFVGEGVGAARALAFEDDSAARSHAWMVHETLLGSGVDFDYVEFPDYLAEGCVTVREHRLCGALPGAVVAVTLHSPTHEILEWNRQLHLASPTTRELGLLEDDAIRGAELLLSPSTRLLEMVRQRLGLGAAVGHVVRYPMEFTGPEPTAPRARGSLAELRFLYFGRIEPRKGVDTLIEAFRRMPELRIELIGRDEAYSPIATSFREWVSADLPPNVTFAPALPREQLLARLRDADVCILPSPWENWPNTCIESMAAARVVLGGRHGGMGEMIEHGVSGFLIDGADPDDLVRVIRDELGAALDRLPAIGRAAAARIRELSDPARYTAAIESAVATARANRGAETAHDASASAFATIVVEAGDADADATDDALAAALALDGARHRVVVLDRTSDPRHLASARARAASDERVRFVTATPGLRAHARSLAIGHLAGVGTLFVRPDDRLRGETLALALDLLLRFDEVAAVSAVAAVRSNARVELRAIAPIDAGLALTRAGRGDVPTVFRTDVLRRADLEFDPSLATLAERGYLLDCVGHGLRIEFLPRVLVDQRAARVDPRTPADWQRQRALLGLLAERHLPPLDPRTQRAVVALLTQAWAIGAFGSVFGELCHRADAAVGGRLPRLAAWLRTTANRLLRAHGRRKDRRAGRRS